VTDETVEVEKEVKLDLEQDGLKDELEEQGEVIEEDSEGKVQELKQPEQDFKEKFLYLAAEMENLKRRNQKDRENLIKYGNEKVLSSLLDVADNLERTVLAVKDEEDEKVKNIRTGVEMVQAQLLSVLKDNGLEAVESVGKIFDPNFHEAMGQREGEGEEDTILEEFQKGYVLNGRLLRASKVIILKK